MPAELPAPPAMSGGANAALDLFWLPLGAGTPIVQFSGRTYERMWSLLQRRRPLALYHCALQIDVPAGDRFSVELAPVPDRDGAARGVVREGAVGTRWLGRLRLFRYELRCWRDGVIPDLAAAVDSPRRLTQDPDLVEHVLTSMPRVPAATWGRDELRTGEMWNCNSVISWLLARCGVPLDAAEPPAGGRAPGWDAGLIVAGRQGRFAGPAMAREPLTV